MTRQKSFAQLVVTAWGWTLLALPVAFVVMITVVSSLPFFQGGNEESAHSRRMWQDILSVVIFGILWLGSVALTLLLAIRHGRRNGLSGNDVRPLFEAEIALLILSVGFALILPGTAGAIIATFLEGCLLAFCGLYIGIAKGLRVPVPRHVWYLTVLVAASIVVCWWPGR